MRIIIHYLDINSKDKMIKFWKSFNIKEVSDYVCESWKELQVLTFNEVWHKTWPDCIHNFASFTLSEQQL